MKLKTVSIGISAHNEQANIENLLNMILAQEQSNFSLVSLTVACDGCSDNTANIVRSFVKKYSFVHVLDDGQRLGKAGRLNDFYKKNTSEIFISFDADIVLSGKKVISEIVSKFDSPKIGLVGGNNLPLRPKNFFEKIIFTWLYIWYEMRKNINGGVSVHNHLGCVSAVSYSLAKEIKIPNNLIPDDDFVYFTSVKHGYQFRFAKNALIYYRTVDNLKDFLVQHGRLVRSKKYAIAYFGDWVEELYKTSRSLKINAIMKYLKIDPLFTILAVAFQLLLRKGVFLPKEEYSQGFWRTAVSSKYIK